MHALHFKSLLNFLVSTLSSPIIWDRFGGSGRLRSAVCLLVKLDFDITANRLTEDNRSLSFFLAGHTLNRST